MITDIILDFVFGFVNTLLSPIAIVWNLPSSGIEYLTSVLTTVSYFIPISGLMPMILFQIALMTFRVIITLIKTLWDLLPLV